jgi:hypothetical protein
MGYTTDFWGYVEIKPHLNDSEMEYLKKFSETRRMKRERGPYFVDGSGMRKAHQRYLKSEAQRDRDREARDELARRFAVEGGTDREVG